MKLHRRRRDRSFGRCANCATRWRTRYPAGDWRELSMGMTNDFRNSHRRRGDDRARRLGHLRVKKWMRKMLNGTKIAFIGSGVMGEAMIKGLLNQGLTTAGCLRASDPWAERLEYIHTTYGVKRHRRQRGCGARGRDRCVEYQAAVAAQGRQDLHSKIHPDALVLSIIAGTRISTLQNKLYHDRIVRAMPNTPGQLGKGMTVWTATGHVTARQLKQTEAILGAMGEQLQVDEEELPRHGDRVERLRPRLRAPADRGDDRRRRTHGLLAPRRRKDGAPDHRRHGGADARQSGRHSAELKNQVTSPGGTTAAGLYELEKASIRAIINDAIFAAYRRSQELGAIE
jgi:pyrroline-5-carboxylate reductase